MEERKFIRDHAKRSRENYELLKSGGSATTALIDSLIGLLILPSQELFNEIARDMLDDGALLEEILSETAFLSSTPRSLYKLAEHLRNSIAHKTVTVSAETLPEPGRPVSVNWLTFKDQNRRESTVFQIKITVEGVEKFFYAFSEAATNL